MKTPYCHICKMPLKTDCVLSRTCWSCGIQATDIRTGQKFFFYTDTQSHAEDSMGLMGYGCSDYTFSFFNDRQQPMDKEECRCSCHCGGFDGDGVCKQPCDDCQCPG